MDNKQLIWIGVRESDIADTGSLFYRSITIHGSGENGNISMEHEFGRRFNHNEEISQYDSFFQKAMFEILETEPNSRFLQYDSLDSKDFSFVLKKKIIYKNSYDLLSFVDDKILHKIWAMKYVNTLPYKLMLMNQLTTESLRNVFPNSKRLVVQRSFSCGGEGTFLISMADENVSEFLPNDAEQCIITEFQENNVPINIHAVIYKDEIILFPPSIQLISYENHRLKYIGSDFTAYKVLSEEEQNLVRHESLKICKALRERGYLGICGIDMILVDGACYFMEVNGRFQASSAVLNRDLVRNGFPTLQDYHMDAFSNSFPSLSKPPLTADGSMITFPYYSKDRNILKWLHTKLVESDDFNVCDDALCWDKKIEPGSYLFQLRSRQAISSVTYQRTVRLHPNVKLCHYVLHKSYSYTNLLNLKIILLSRGVFISSSVWQIMEDMGGVDWEEFGAVTLRLFDNTWITAPCLEAWHTISPIEINFDSDSGKVILCFYGKQLFPIDVMRADPHGEKRTKKGHFVKDIVYMNPDRLRVYHRNGCALQDKGLGCKFCDLYGVEKPFDFEEICEAVSYYWNDNRVNHYLIGGGSELENNKCDMIVAIAKFLYEKSGKHIYLMSQPIDDKDILNELKACGVTEVAFNIEMFNRNIAERVMPGKARNTLQNYYDSLKLAVELWGDSGNVRSVILLGFDDIKEFERGVRELCMIGVSPILSLFHPCVGTPLENYMPLDEKETIIYYETAKVICEEFGIKIGPSCKACQNNTIALEI